MWVSVMRTVLPSSCLPVSQWLGYSKRRKRAEAEVQCALLAGRKRQGSFSPAVSGRLSASVEWLERQKLSHSMTFGSRTPTCVLARGLDPLV